MKVFTFSLLIWFSMAINDAESLRFPGFFIPEEVQTILSIIWSHLPPTKIGSDKRFGVGFRLGRNADAQILVELGPQSETQPLVDGGSGFSKRENKVEKGEINRPRPPKYSELDASIGATESKNIKQRKNSQNAYENSNTAQETQSNTTDNASQLINSTTPSSLKRKRKQTRRLKKVKPADDLRVNKNDVQTNIKSSQIDSRNSQKRSELFYNNLMSWLQTYNTPQNQQPQNNQLN